MDSIQSGAELVLCVDSKESVHGESEGERESRRGRAVYLAPLRQCARVREEVRLVLLVRRHVLRYGTRCSRFILFSRFSARSRPLNPLLPLQLSTERRSVGPSMSLVEEYGEGEYERAPKRLKTAEVEEGEELEEGEDSDSASAGLPGDEEEAARRPPGKSRDRWSQAKYGPGRKVRVLQVLLCVCVCVCQPTTAVQTLYVASTHSSSLQTS